MSGEMKSSKRVVPECERCWIIENSKWEADAMTADGELVVKLTSILIPSTVIPGEVHVCYRCGDLTIVGLYVEKDEDEIQYDVDPDDIVKLD